MKLLFRRITVNVLLFLISAGTAPAAVVYIDARNTDGPWDGMGWSTAFRSLQAGIDRAAQSDAEVWVTAGTYFPSASDDRNA